MRLYKKALDVTPLVGTLCYRPIAISAEVDITPFVKRLVLNLESIKIQPRRCCEV
jgi:hypothetical protein